MPNRIIRETLLDSERYNAVTIDARLLYVELLLVADDYGLANLSPVFLRRRTSIAAGLSAEAIEALLTQLVDQDMLRKYEVDGLSLAFIPRYRNWPQSLKPRWPLPPDEIGGSEVKELIEKRHQRANHPARRSGDRVDHGSEQLENGNAEPHADLEK
jgi:hypothetical protein